MPTLGLFKKKRTKETPGPKDLPTSPIADSSADSTASSVLRTVPSASSQTSYPQSANGSGKISEPFQAAGLPGPVSQSTPASKPHDVSLDERQLPQQQTTSSINNTTALSQLDGIGEATMNGRSNGAASKEADLSLATPSLRTTKGKYTLSDFAIQRTLGTGSFGRVHLVQSRHNQRFYAVKVLKKQQVVKMKQVEHTNDERKMLQKVKHPFLITLWGTFQDSKNLYMVMDFVEGGELFSLLRKSQVSES